jgi:hypothetical protein
MGDYTLRVGERLECARVQAENGHFWRAAKPLGLTLLLIALAACGDGEKTNSPVNRKAVGALASVEASETVVGFFSGNIKSTRKIGRFKISKHPVSNDQYKECRAAGVCGEPKIGECSEPDLAKAASDGLGDSVTICVGHENAKAFCQWVGGRLPTLPEWLSAARGANIQRYPWGSVQGTCKQHPRVDHGLMVLVDGNSLEGCSVNAVDALATRRHADGAARSGMEDILISPAELVIGETDSTFGACGEGRPCTVYGAKPGSIDSVASYYVTQDGIRSGDEENEPRLTPRAYAFRCVVEK